MDVSFPFAFAYHRTSDLKQRLLDPFLVSSALSVMGRHYPYLVSINSAVIAPALLLDLFTSLEFISLSTCSLHTSTLLIIVLITANHLRLSLNSNQC